MTYCQICYKRIYFWQDDDVYDGEDFHVKCVRFQKVSALTMQLHRLVEELSEKPTPFTSTDDLIYQILKTNRDLMAFVEMKK